MDERIFHALAAGVPVVTRGTRLARAIRREFDARQTARGAAAWQAAPVTPWSGWLDSLWEQLQYAAAAVPARLGRWQEWALWNRILRAAPEADQLLQPGAAAAAAQQSWALAVDWRVDLSRAEEEGGDDARAFAGWAREFQQTTEEQGLLEGVRAVDRLRESFDGLRLPERLVLAGFDEFSPQQIEFIDALAEAGSNVQIVRPGGRDFEAATTVKVALPDAAQSFLTAARWARRLLEERPGESIGIVVPDLAARRAQVERIFRSILEPASQLPGSRRMALVNLSAGEALADYPMVRSALAILRLQPDDIEWRDVSAFVLDRHLAASDSERSNRAGLDRRLREIGLSRWTLDEVRREARREPDACPVLSRTISGLLRIWKDEPERQHPSAWAATFAAALEAAGWPGEQSLSSAEFQTVEAWQGVLSEFAGAGLTAGELNRGEAVSLVQRIAAATVFQPEGDAAPVQILGTLEATGLEFDHLWIAGFDGETWPPAARPDPFLPVRMQREAGLPHSSADRELAFAALITGRLLASSPDVVVSYPTHDGDRELLPSPLIISVPAVAPDSLRLWDGRVFDEVIRASREVERIVDEQGPPVPEEVHQTGGARVFQDQAACPFRAFVEIRLAAEDLESPGPGLDASDRGILIHSTLERFWTEVRSHDALCARPDIPQVIRDSVAWALARFEERRRAPLPERFAQIERRRLERVAAEWLEVEKRREPFEVIEPELERDAEVGGIRFRLKLDRIDRLRTGGDVIVDYKTGARTTKAWEGDRPEEPQLPLYSVVYGDGPLAGVAFGLVKTGDMRFRGVQDRDGVLPGGENVDLAAKVGEWRAVMERLAADFRAGHAEADPKNINQSCRYCALAGLCRIADGGQLFDEEAA